MNFLTLTLLICLAATTTTTTQARSVQDPEEVYRARELRRQFNALSHHRDAKRRRLEKLTKEVEEEAEEEGQRFGDCDRVLSGLTHPLQRENMITEVLLASGNDGYDGHNAEDMTAFADYRAELAYTTLMIEVAERRLALRRRSFLPEKDEDHLFGKWGRMPAYRGEKDRRNRRPMGRQFRDLSDQVEAKRARLDELTLEEALGQVTTRLFGGGCDRLLRAFQNSLERESMVVEIILGGNVAQDMVVLAKYRAELAYLTLMVVAAEMRLDERHEATATAATTTKTP